MNTKKFGIASAAVLSLLLAPSFANALCGGPLSHNKFDRPLDYNDPDDREWINVVERAHFTAEVEALIKGINVPLPGDIDYTLRQYPNHYRALHAMARWQLKNPRPSSSDYLAIDCYFQRALAFKPQDPVLFMLYGIYLHKDKRLDDALAAYGRAQVYGIESAEFFYNLGLLHLDRGEYGEARDNALLAYQRGYPLPGLRNKLRRMGHWKG